MCAGSQERWNFFKKTDFPVKQLILIHKKPLLQITQGQFPDSVVVIGDKEYSDKIAKQSKKIFKVKHSGSLIESFYNTRELWEDLNIILLGDVLFSKETIEKIKLCAEELMFFGNNSEIFALVFKDKERILKLCQGCLADGWSKFWHLYRMSQGLSITEHQIKDNFTRTEGTRDFDCVLQYIDYMKCQKKSR
jgi:hypothetical protein